MVPVGGTRAAFSLCQKKPFFITQKLSQCLPTPTLHTLSVICSLLSSRVRRVRYARPSCRHVSGLSRRKKGTHELLGFELHLKHEPRLAKLCARQF